VGEPAPSSESFVDPELCSDAFWEVVGTAWPSSADVDDTLDASSPEARLDVDVAVEDGAEIGVVEVVAEDDEEVAVAVTVELLLVKVVAVEDDVLVDVAVLVLVDGCVRAQSTNDVLAAAEARPSEFAQ